MIKSYTLKVCVENQHFFDLFSDLAGADPLSRQSLEKADSAQRHPQQSGSPLWRSAFMFPPKQDVKKFIKGSEK